MTRLIRYEFYKLFCKRSILVVLILFSVINLFKINNEFHSYSYLADGKDSRSWNSVYWQLYEKYRGEITTDKINNLLDLYQPLEDATADMTASTDTDDPNTMTGNIYSDENILEKYYVQPMEYFYNYRTYASEVAKKAKENAAFYKEQGLNFEVRKNSVIYNLYSGRNIPAFAYQEMYNYYLNYDFSNILVLFLCLYGIISTFVYEKETQMDMLLLTNPNGGKKTVLAKIVAVTLFVISVVIWFSVLDYLGFSFSFGTMEGYNLPLYAISNFSTAAVNCNLWQYVVLSAITKAIGIWTMSMVFLLISMFWRNALIPFVADFGAALCLIITGASQSYSSNIWLKIINPYSLLTNRILFGKTEFIGFAGYPIQSFLAAIIFAVIVGMVVITVMVILSKKELPLPGQEDKMSGFMYEIKKIMLHQKGLCYIVIVLLFGTVWLVASDNPYNSAMEQYKSEYEWYLDKVNGYCTEESSLYLEQEAERIADAREKQNDLLQSYYDGKISESEYKKESQEIGKVLEHQNGFEVVYQQYLYTCENAKNRYFLQTNGWTGLLGGGTLNFVLFLGILLLVTPVFCSEYSCQMDALILTSKEGRKSSLHKLLIVISGVLLMCVSISLIEYGFYSLKYGLPNGNYPIQSLSYFAGSNKSITLFEGYVYIGLLRLFGSVFLTILLMFISVLAKKYAVTLLAGAVSVIIPYVGLSKTIIYRLPLPLPFLLGTDFFAGDIVSSDAFTGDEKIVFAEIHTITLLILFSVSVFLCILAAAWILRSNSNKWQMKTRKMRNVPTLAIILSFVLTMTGCSDNGKSQNFIYNSSAEYDCMGYEITQDAETFDYYLKNASTGEMLHLVRSPMFGAFSDEEKVCAFCVCSPYLYYTTSVTESYVNRVGNYNSSITKVSVVELNLDTFEEKIVFEQITNSGRSLFDIDYETGDKWKFLEFHHDFFINNDSIFFIGDDGITEVNRFTKGITKLDIPTSGNISFDGENIFYKNEQSVLTRYHVPSGETFTYEKVVAYDFCIDEQSIYYVSRTDGSRVYSCNKDGNNIRLISDTPAMSVTCDTGNIYILAKESGENIVLSKSR